MSGTVNKVILVGNLGKDPEIRTTQDGKEIANMTVATTESWNGKDGNRQERTEWHKVVIFNPSAVGFVKQYAKKGAKVYVEGQLQTRKWKDKDGNDKYSTEVVLQGYNGAVSLLDKREKSDGAVAAGGNVVDDEILF